MSQRKTVVVLLKDDKVEAYSQIKNIVDIHPEFSLRMLYKHSLPVNYKGWDIHKVKLNKSFEENER